LRQSIPPVRGHYINSRFDRCSDCTKELWFMMPMRVDTRSNSSSWWLEIRIVVPYS
jgi:hypothetical protein